MQNIFVWMRSIDRRYIYLVLAVALIVSLIVGRPVTPEVLQSVQDMYDTVEKAPANAGDNKIVLIGMTFSPSTLGESGNQARAIIRHLMLAKKRFAIISVGEANGAIIGNALVQDLAKQYGYKYGVDWISFGFQPNIVPAFYTSFARDIPGTIKTDYVMKQPLSTFPIMQGIHTVKDNVALFIDVTASASIFSWIEVVQGRYGLKIGYACTGVMTAEAYPFLDSGQLFGMLPGLKGAADYERLVDEKEARELADGQITHAFDASKMTSVTFTSARRLMFTQNIAHLVILLFIILGNIGLVLSRRAKAKSTKEEA